ncbi:protein BNIP5 [Daubentonia madagascariensis]|uniref:Protein BNIP5 n=1 Tax=Daubentonia madagascariensis TaxID=31869 RepID=A0ABD2EZD7_DAUMA
MEGPRSPRKPVADSRAKSLDRPQAPKKDLESRDCQRLSLPTASSRKMLRRTASDGARRSESPAQSAEAQGTATTALTLEETREFLSSEQRPMRDTKKDKAQRRAQQGWLKTVLNFFLRTDPEEPREKASRRPKGKEGLPQPTDPPEATGEPALRKKAHDKKTSRKKHGRKKHVAEETKGAQDEEPGGPEAGLSKTAAAPRSKEVDPGPALRGGEDSDLHQSLLIEEGGAAASDVSPQATGHQREEEIKKPDQDAIIKMIVELLKRVGDQWEEERLQASQPEVALQNPAPAARKKSQEKKSSPKRAFSLKKHSSEEPKRAGAADVSSSEAWPPKRPSFLPLALCVGGHRPSISSSLGLEEPEVQGVLSTDGGGPSPFELSTHPGSQGPEEEPWLDRASESKEFVQKIIALLQDAEEQGGEKQPQVQEVEVAVANLAPSCRRKSQEKKSSHKRGFSHKKHSSKEPKRAGAAGAASPEAHRPKRPSYLPLCVGGHRPSVSSSLDPEGLELREPSPAEGGPAGISEVTSQARSPKPEGGPQWDGAYESKELIIQKLVLLLQEVDGQLGQQIRRHPSFKRIFYEFSDSSLSKLVATLSSQVAHSSELDRNLAKRPYPFGFGLANKFAGHKSHAISILMGLRGHYSCTQFPYRESQQNITSPESQSPD